MISNNTSNQGPGRRRGRVALAALLAATAMTGGCYGRFPMTRALYKMNGDVENKVVKNVVFWLLAWFPIYWFAQLGDAVIFNLIDFWTGAGIDLGAVSVQGDRTVTLKSSEDRNVLFMTIEKRGLPVSTSRFIRVEDGKYEVRDESNVLVGGITRGADQNLTLTDDQGRVLRTINVAEYKAKAGA